MDKYDDDNMPVSDTPTPVADPKIHSAPNQTQQMRGIILACSG